MQSYLPRAQAPPGGESEQGKARRRQRHKSFPNIIVLSSGGVGHVSLPLLKGRMPRPAAAAAWPSSAEAGHRDGIYDEVF